LPQKSTVSLRVFNNLGQEIRSLVNNITQPADYYKVYWDGKDNSGKTVASGLYYYKLVSKNSIKTFEQSRKMLYFK